MTDIDAIARDADEGREAERRRPGDVLPDVVCGYKPEEGTRALRVNDNLDVRRRGGRILVTAGPVQMEISPEEARRAADALSAFAAVADADDVEVEEVGRVAA